MTPAISLFCVTPKEGDSCIFDPWHQYPCYNYKMSETINALPSTNMVENALQLFRPNFPKGPTPFLQVCCWFFNFTACSFHYCSYLIAMEMGSTVPFQLYSTETNASIEETFVFPPAKVIFVMIASPGLHFICGNQAYHSLPVGWKGHCYLGNIFPGLLPLVTPTDLHEPSFTSCPK